MQKFDIEYVKETIKQFSKNPNGRHMNGLPKYTNGQPTVDQAEELGQFLSTFGQQDCLTACSTLFSQNYGKTFVDSCQSVLSHHYSNYKSFFQQCVITPQVYFWFLRFSLALC